MFAASKSGRVAAVATDPYFPYVPLLLETTSTNGQQNNTFLDSSTNNFTITRNGTPTQGSVTPYWPNGYWSNFFSGTTQYVSVGGTTSLSANFTIEFWFFPTASANSNFFGIDDTQNPNSLACTYNAGGPTINVFADAGTPISGGAPLVLNSWNHVALVRSGSTVTVYVNGVQKATGSVPNAISGSLQIGRWLDSGSYTNGITGYLSNFKVSNTNIYSGSTFSVPTSPLTSSANTLLLTLQDNRVKDNSSSPKTLTVSGSPRTQAFQPFSPTASYTAAAYGGSGYFNGSTDYLSIAYNVALNLVSGDFTIETWFYCTALSATEQQIINKDGTFGTSYSQYSLGITSAGKLVASLGNGNGVSPTFTDYGNNTTVPLNTWNHVALVRTGSTIKVFFNGAQVTSTAQVTAMSDGGKPLLIGYQTGQPATYVFNGYISNSRIVKGTAVYTANFTPPTAPVTAITNTSLLTNFTNAGIYDAAVQNNATTAGDAQASITVAKWPPTSMKFDGTGDYLSILSGPQLNLVSGDFTIETWFYCTTLTASNQQILNKDGVFNASYSQYGLAVSSAGQLVAVLGNGNGLSPTETNYGASTSVTLNVWNHVAMVRTGSTIKVFFNGTQVTSTAQVTAMSDGGKPLLIGYQTSQAAGNYFNGYIQDTRITKGIARYTASFSVPTAAFPTR